MLQMLQNVEFNLVVCFMLTTFSTPMIRPLQDKAIYWLMLLGASWS